MPEEPARMEKEVKAEEVQKEKTKETDGEKRANAVSDYFAAKGISSARINTIGYGEEKPLCTEQNEDCWQSNRRVHFVVAQ